MALLPRDVGQTLITKLDLGHVSVKGAKAHALRYGVKVTGRTREDAGRSICRQIQKVTA